MRKLTLRVLLTAVLMCFFSVSSALADQVDQSYLLGYNFNAQSFGPNAMLGQTFTAGISGELTTLRFGHLDTHLYGADNSYLGSGDVILSIRDVTSTGLPGDTIFGSVVLNGNYYSSNVITLPTGIIVLAGTQYAIVLQAAQERSMPRWRGYFPGGYSGGTAFMFGIMTPNQWTEITIDNGPTDFSFETTVNPVPEPASLMLVATGLAGMIIRRRRGRS